MAEFSSNTDEINSPPICNTSSDSYYNAVILGGTGATGKYVVAELLLSTLVRKVTLISRREYQLPSEYASSINLDSPDMKSKLIQHFITDIASVDPSQARSIFDGQHALINCLGTTRNAAGSNERMTAIDHDIPMFFARFAHDAGVRHASILTSNGSNPNSMFFYFKLKGRIEESFLQISFPCLSIWRPGMLERGDQRRFVEKVMKSGIGPVKKADLTFSYLLMAARDGNLNYLQEHSELVSQAKDRFGATVPHFAARGGHKPILIWIRSELGNDKLTEIANNGATPAHDAAALGKLDCLQYLVDIVGSNVLQSEDHTGAKFIHLASRFGHLEVVKWLVEEKSCSPVAPTMRGITPVHLAAAKGSVECLKWFSTKVDNINDIRTESGATPIYFAAQEGSLDCLKFLVLEQQGKPRDRANDGMSPLHAAAQMGHLDCLMWLVKHGGADVMERDKEGATPAHFAAARGHVDIIRWLMNNGAVAVKDELGGTPLHDAAEHGRIEIITVLLEAGADVDAKDMDGQTAADVADNAKHYNCAEILRSSNKKKFFLRKNSSFNSSAAYNTPQKYTSQYGSPKSKRSGGPIRNFFYSSLRFGKKYSSGGSSPNIASKRVHKNISENDIGKESSKSMPNTRPYMYSMMSPSQLPVSAEKDWMYQQKSAGNLTSALITPNRKLGGPGLQKKLVFSEKATIIDSTDEIGIKKPSLEIYTSPAIKMHPARVHFDSKHNDVTVKVSKADQQASVVPQWKMELLRRRNEKNIDLLPRIDRSTEEKSSRDTPEWKKELYRIRELKRTAREVVY